MRWAVMPHRPALLRETLFDAIYANINGLSGRQFMLGCTVKAYISCLNYFLHAIFALTGTET